MDIQKQMQELRLYGMERSWQELLEMKKHHELTLSEGLELLLQAEEEDKKNRRFERLRKNARFRYQASIEELAFDASRGMNKELIMTLAKGDYIRDGQSVLITGAAGCGKSFLSSALGHQACCQGYKVVYYSLQKLLHQTKTARMEGKMLKFFERLAKTDLLILDDFGLFYLEQQHRLDLMEILEDRHNKKSTIIASQLPVEHWYDIIGEATMADAILDRFVHTSYRFELKGDSMRKKQ